MLLSFLRLSWNHITIIPLESNMFHKEYWSLNIFKAFQIYLFYVYIAGICNSKSVCKDKLFTLNR